MRKILQFHYLFGFLAFLRLWSWCQQALHPHAFLKTLVTFLEDCHGNQDLLLPSELYLVCKAELGLSIAVIL